MGTRSFLLLVVAVLTVLLALGVWFYPANADFRAENTLWNGLSHSMERFDIRPLDSLSDLSTLSPGATLILIPYLDFNSLELEQLRYFIAQGGRLVLADDYGFGNRVLEYLKLATRFAGETLLDPLVNHKNGYFPRITRLQPDTLTAHTDNLVFNHATVLKDTSGTRVVALSSPFSFLDINGNGTHEADEPSGPLPVISRQALGEGEVILISDPSIFINGMEMFQGNISFLQNLVATTKVLYIDQSHLTQAELYRARYFMKQARRLATTPYGTAGLVIAALMASLRPVWHWKKK